MGNGPFEDVFPIENGDFPASYVSLPEGRVFLMMNLLHSGFGGAHNFRASLGVCLVTTESTQVCPFPRTKWPLTIVINGVITP